MPYFVCTDPAPTQLYTLSLHDALPISPAARVGDAIRVRHRGLHPDADTGDRPGGGDGGEREVLDRDRRSAARPAGGARSEEHTSELQSHVNLVCRLLLEKKKNTG